jgi:hypothetical protein
MDYEKKLTLFVAIAAFGRALGFFAMAVFAKSMSLVFAEFHFAGFGIAVADFAIFQIVLMGFVVESDVAVFGFEGDGVGGEGGAAGESDEHGSNNEVFHGDFSCVLVNRMRGISAAKEI